MNGVTKLDKLEQEDVSNWLIQINKFSLTSTKNGLVYKRYIYNNEYIEISILCNLDHSILIKVLNLSTCESIIRNFHHINGSSVIEELGDILIDILNELNINYQ